MNRTIALEEALTRLAQLVREAENGDEIIITVGGRPRARLVPLSGVPGQRRFGGWEHELWIAPDFDDPLPDEILDAFEGGRAP